MGYLPYVTDLYSAWKHGGIRRWYLMGGGTSGLNHHDWNHLPLGAGRYFNRNKLTTNSSTEPTKDAMAMLILSSNALFSALYNNQTWMPTMLISITTMPDMRVLVLFGWARF